MITIKKIFIIILLVAIISIITLKNFNIEEKILRKIYKKQYSEYVEKYAKEYNIDECFIYSVIKAESNFEQDAVSSSGAIGLMQLMQETAMEVAKKENIKFEKGETLYNAEQNIKIGTAYLKGLMEMYNQNYLLAITAYNAGIGTVEKWIKEGTIKKDGSDVENIPYKETNMYVRKIIRNYNIYKKIY